LQLNLALDAYTITAMRIAYCVRGVMAGVIVVCLDACAPSQSHSNDLSATKAATLRKEILDRTAAFSKAVLSASSSGWSAAQVAALAEFYDDETIVFPPRGAPIFYEHQLDADATHNVGSIRVLEKCSFSLQREESGEAAGKDVAELALVLR
jgi:hypothetical protein